MTKRKKKKKKTRGPVLVAISVFSFLVLEGGACGHRLVSRLQFHPFGRVVSKFQL